MLQSKMQPDLLCFRLAWIFLPAEVQKKYSLLLFKKKLVGANQDACSF